MTQDQIGYAKIIDQAMRRAVREVLLQVEQGGLPGNHHFYLTFDTRYPGVSIDRELMERYPEDMTIVLQHQFWDFEVTEDYFTVSLSFSGKQKNLVIPFDALTAFADPSIQFGLQFQQTQPVPQSGLPDAESRSALTSDPVPPQPGNGKESSNTPGIGPDGAEIITLDQFRKK